MEYLDSADVIYINETVVGPGQLRDAGLLESAVMRPRQTLFERDACPDVHTKAAALTESLLKNHAFVDGNKRTALLGCIAFYGLNGYSFRAPDTDLLHFILDVATGDLAGVDAIARPLARWTIRQD